MAVVRHSFKHKLSATFVHEDGCLTPMVGIRSITGAAIPEGEIVAVEILQRLDSPVAFNRGSRGTIEADIGIGDDLRVFRQEGACLAFGDRAAFREIGLKFFVFGPDTDSAKAIATQMLGAWLAAQMLPPIKDRSLELAIVSRFTESDDDE